MSRPPAAPSATRLLPGGFDTRFDYGLRAIIAGLERALADEPRLVGQYQSGLCPDPD